MGQRILLQQASMIVSPGQKVALVGRNGSGKTSLFRVLLGELEPDQGMVSLPAGTRVGSVAQEAPCGEDPPLQVVLQADREYAQLTQEESLCQDPIRLAQIHERLGQIGGYSASARAAHLLAGLGVTEEMQKQACRELSGGWRMRVSLAAALFAAPELLLLDEPTNHLDLEATLWLTQYLKKYPGTLIVISHDRNLLNAVHEVTVHLDHARLTAYKGGYDQFLIQRAEHLAQKEALQKKRAVQRAHLQSFVERFGAKASKAKQAQSRKKALERLPPIVIEGDQEPITLQFPEPGLISSPLLELEEASVGYGETPVLQHLNLRIHDGDRIALLGANGNGKSTLVKLLAGRLAPSAGKISRAPKLRIGYFAQHQEEELQLELTALEQATLAMPGLPAERVRSHLGRFGLSQERALTLVGQLSGGEKARLLLALMTVQAPHLLILDEPTNHLDLETCDALCDALNAFEGAVVMISHDAHLIELCADQLWLVHRGSCRPFEGDLQEYRDSILDKESSSAGPCGTVRQQERRAAAATRAALAPLQKQLKECERALTALYERQRKIEEDLAHPSLYEEQSYARLRALQEDLRVLKAQITESEAEWMEAQERLERS